MKTHQSSEYINQPIAKKLMTLTFGPNIYGNAGKSASVQNNEPSMITMYKTFKSF